MFHNLLGYDAHLFIKEMGKNSRDMEVIAKNKEDYISFSVDVAVDKYVDKEGNEKEKLTELRFINSFKFMSFKDYSELQYDLPTRKGIYPYEYM